MRGRQKQRHLKVRSTLNSLERRRTVGVWPGKPKRSKEEAVNLMLTYWFWEELRKEYSELS